MTFETNYGINGQGLNYVYWQSTEYGTITADGATRVDAAQVNAVTNYLVIFAGTNDIFLNGASGAAT